MKRIVTTLIAVALLHFAFATKKTIGTGATSFDPSTTEMTFGDTIVFNVGGGHTATEVSQSTWNANGTTPNGGFNLGAGSNQQVVGLTVGTHYFVCQNHVGMGMKGTIVVNAVSKTRTNTANAVRIFPNPVSSRVQLENAGATLKTVTLTALDGRVLKTWSVDPQNVSLLMDDVPQGLYLLSGFADGEQLWVEKFQKL